MQSFSYLRASLIEFSYSETSLSRPPVKEPIRTNDISSGTVAPKSIFIDGVGECHTEIVSGPVCPYSGDNFILKLMSSQCNGKFF